MPLRRADRQRSAAKNDGRYRPTLVILSREDARWAGINPMQEEYTTPATTANGVVLLAPVVLVEVVVGDRRAQRTGRRAFRQYAGGSARDVVPF